MVRVAIIFLLLAGCSAQRTYQFPGKRPAEPLVCETAEHCYAWDSTDNTGWYLHFKDLEKCHGKL